jgi:serine/threonine protein kinase
MWGLGVCIYELMTLKHPFDGKGHYHIINSIIDKTINNIICEYKTDDNKMCEYSEPLKNLVLQMLRKVLIFFFIFILFFYFIDIFMYSYIETRRTCFNSQSDSKSYDCGLYKKK